MEEWKYGSAALVTNFDLSYNRLIPFWTLGDFFWCPAIVKNPSLSRQTIADQSAPVYIFLHVGAYVRIHPSAL
jgi:hypothetical protein